MAVCRHLANRDGHHRHEPERTRWPSDRAGNPHLSYISRSGNLFYALRTTQSWQTQAVNTNWLGLCRDSSLALDSSDAPRIAYHVTYLPDNQNGPLAYEYLVYAQRIGADWQSQVIDSEWSGITGEQPSLIVDAADRPHIAYNYEPDYYFKHGVKYASWTGSDWKVEIVVETGNGDP